MDPNAMYNMLMQALMDGDLETARDHAWNLRCWVSLGGFAPMAGDWDRVTRNVMKMAA